MIAGLDHIAGNPACGDQLRDSAANAARMARSRQGRPERPGPISEDAHGPEETLALQEERIFQLAARDKEAAKQQLLNLVISCARKKDFRNAERLRERIYEVDPMALMEIIQAGEVIEEEKSGAISEDQLDTWAKLLMVLSKEEFNALYHEMEERLYSPGETIVDQGAKNDELFFINQGSVKVSCLVGNKEFFLKNLGNGEIVGENFFNTSVWTVSLTAQQQTAIAVLPRDRLNRLEESVPCIESKLIGYYNRYSDIQAVIGEKNMDRRVHERFKAESKIQLQIIDDNGRILSSFQGELNDISVGGLSFFVRITKKENCRLLLGRKIKAAIPSGGDREKVLLGRIIGVQVCDLVLSDCSVHVNFENQLSATDLKTIRDRGCP